MTAFAIAQAVSRQIGYQLESLTAADAGAEMTLAYANEVGEEIARLGAGAQCWPVLAREHTFDTVADQAEYDLPSDLARILMGSAFFGTLGYEMHQMSPSMENQLRTGVVTAVADPYYRIQADTIRLWPTPTQGGEPVVFSYVSRNWVLRADGTEADHIENDTDEIVLDAPLFRLGLRAELKSQREIQSAPMDRQRFELDGRKKLGEALGVSRYPLWGQGRGGRRAGWPTTTGPLTPTE